MRVAITLVLMLAACGDEFSATDAAAAADLAVPPNYCYASNCFYCDTPPTESCSSGQSCAGFELNCYCLNGGWNCCYGSGYCQPSSCRFIFDCAPKSPADQCEKGYNQSAINTYDAVVACQREVCGDGAGDAGVGMPCNGQSSSACDTCRTNTLVDSVQVFYDANGLPVTCVPTSAPECGKCAALFDTCVLQCFGQSDCTGLRIPDGGATHCVQPNGYGEGRCQ